MADEKIEPTPNELPKLTYDNGITLLLDALSATLTWLEPYERSKAIIVADPRDKTKLIAVHNGADGCHILSPDEFKSMISSLCEDCQSNIREYSVIHTGQNVLTGLIDPDVYIGLHGMHMEEEEEWNDEDFDEPDEKPHRTLN